MGSDAGQKWQVNEFAHDGNRFACHLQGAGWEGGGGASVSPLSSFVTWKSPVNHLNLGGETPQLHLAACARKFASGTRYRACWILIGRCESKHVAFVDISMNKTGRRVPANDNLVSACVTRGI